MVLKLPMKIPAGVSLCWMFIIPLTVFMMILPPQVFPNESNLGLQAEKEKEIRVSTKQSLKNKTLKTVPTKKSRVFYPIISAAADRYNVDPALVMAIIMAESGYNPFAISKRGAKGLMQLMPATADALGVEDPYDPEHNINGGVKYLKQLINQFQGNRQLAVAAYNAGSKKIEKYNGIPPSKTIRYYVKKVFEYYRHYKNEIGRQSNTI